MVARSILRFCFSSSISLMTSSYETRAFERHDLKLLLSMNCGLDWVSADWIVLVVDAWIVYRWEVIRVAYLVLLNLYVSGNYWFRVKFNYSFTSRISLVSFPPLVFFFNFSTLFMPGLFCVINSASYSSEFFVFTFDFSFFIFKLCELFLLSKCVFPAILFLVF